MIRVTHTTMIQTDGTTTIYETFRGNLHRENSRASDQWIDLTKDYEPVATHRYGPDAPRPNLYLLSKAHETDDAPAYHFGNEE